MRSKKAFAPKGLAQVSPSPNHSALTIDIYHSEALQLPERWSITAAIMSKSWTASADGPPKRLLNSTRYADNGWEVETLIQ